MAKLKITTFNTHLLETPTLDMEEHYQMEDDQRATIIGQLIVASGADVVVLNEVFATTDKKAMRKAVAATLPHYVLEVGDNDLFEQDSGLMLFSRYPFLPLKNHDYRPAGLVAVSNGAKTSDVAFIEFGHGLDFAPALASLLGGPTWSDALADKGVAVVILDTPFGPLPVAFSHLWASYGNDSVCETLTKFDMRQHQLARAVDLLRLVVQDESLPSSVFLGDLNVIGNHHVGPIHPLPYGTLQLVAMCGTTPGRIQRREIRTIAEFEAGLPRATAALLPTHPGLLKLLAEVALRVCTGSLLEANLRIGCICYPVDWDTRKLLDSGAEWERNIHSGKIGAQFDDGWSRLYGGIADPGDLGTTTDVSATDSSHGERLDYILVPKDDGGGDHAPRWTVHHMTRAYNLFRGDSGVTTDWGTIGSTALSDHIGVNAYLAPHSAHCSPNRAQVVQALPFASGYVVADPEAFFWLRVDLEGTVRINPRSGRATLYHSSQMSIPVRMRASENPEVAEYKLPAGRYFVRLMTTPGDLEGGIEIQKPDGARREDALHLDPCEPFEFPMTPGIPHGDADEVWFKVQTEPCDDEDGRQRLQLRIASLDGDPGFLMNHEVKVFSVDGELVGRIREGDGGAFVSEQKHDARRYPVLLVVVRRLNMQSLGFVISWTTDLIVFGALRLACISETPGAGDDEIVIRMTADTRVVTNGTDGWASVGDFEAGSNPAGLDGSNVLQQSAYVRAKRIEVELYEDDIDDVFGSAPERFDNAILDESGFDRGLRFKRVTLDITRVEGGHYQLSGGCGRRSFDIPVMGSPV